MKIAAATLMLALVAAASVPVQAQPPFGGFGGGAAPPTGRDAAPFDLTGQWVSIVNEDWRWRMVTPPPGDFPGVPLNQAGRQLANAWDESQDGACEAYGAAGLMRMPTRLRIDWDGDDVIVVRTDAGRQTRRLEFSADATPGAPSLQGFSRAAWQRPAGARGLFGPRGGGAGGLPGGYLVVTTDNLLPGWLRRNGVPYSEQTGITEYFDRFAVPRDKQEGGTVVIPGHGRLADEADVVEYRDMVTIIRDRVQAMIDQGMSRDQVLAARPSRDYDARYGTSERWTPDLFVDAIYRTLCD